MYKRHVTMGNMRRIGKITLLSLFCEVVLRASEGFTGVRLHIVMMEAVSCMPQVEAEYFAIRYVIVIRSTGSYNLTY